MNAKLVTENKSRKQILDEAEHEKNILLDEKIKLQAQLKQLQKFKEQHFDMHNEIQKGRDLNMGYTTLIWELTQEVERRGGDAGKYRDKLHKISSIE